VAEFRSLAAQEIISEALAYWRRVGGGRCMPSRRDLDPVDIPRLLPFVMLVDVLSGPLDFKFRLIGTEVSAIIARHSLGRRFSTIPHMAVGNQVWAEYEAVVNTREPLAASIGYVGNDNRVRAVRHALMPLSNSGKAVDMVFVAVEIERG
jgi:hypothetical protein